MQGVRQHFLRMRPGATHARMRVAGFGYDSTYGFPDRNGFRLGVADVVPLWDAAGEQVEHLDEAPFCWMDRALSKYQSVEDPGAWVEDGLRLANVCRSVSGLWVGVWHPNVFPALGFPGATAAFEHLVGRIAAERPFFGTLSTMVRWRSARRRVVARGIDPAGHVHATVEGAGGLELALEDARGRRLEPVRAS